MKLSKEQRKYLLSRLEDLYTDLNNSKRLLHHLKENNSDLLGLNECDDYLLEQQKDLLLKCLGENELLEY